MRMSLLTTATLLMLTGCIGSGENTSISKASIGNFPKIEGIDLHGNTQNLPDNFAGTLNIVAIGFERHHQDAIDTWIPIADRFIAANNNVKFYEVPVIYKTNALWRGWINNGMRMGVTDDTARSRTITVYTDQDAFADIFALDKTKSALLLLDSKGTALWKHEGNATEAAERTLNDIIIEYFKKP
jgi:hypothetical protein